MARNWTRRDVIGMGIGAAATILSMPIEAFAGAGAGGDIGGAGGVGSFYGYPWYEWYDSYNGNEQGHTVQSNLDFWDDYVNRDLDRVGGLKPAIGFSIHAPRMGWTVPNAERAMKTAMDRALARNATGGTYASDHVRIVGLAYCGGVDAEVPLAISRLSAQGFIDYCNMRTKPDLDSGNSGVGILKSSDGWSQTTINNVHSILINDILTDFASCDGVNSHVVFVTWAVSDADMTIDLTVRKKSERPKVVKDVSGAQYTVYKDSNCSVIATTVSGQPAILTVGEDGNSNTVRLTRSSGYEGSGSGQAHYYVKETRGPSNGLFYLDENVYTITDTEHLNLVIEGTKFYIDSTEKVKTGFITIDKDLSF